MGLIDFLSKPLAPEEDVEFSHWYSNIAEKSNLSPDPDDPKHYYDYRAAYESGAGLDEKDPGGETNWGITKKTATELGYKGEMKDLV